MALISAVDLARRIVAKIPEYIFPDSRGNWPELRTIIADIGADLGMETHLTHGPTKRKEFLCDVCWINPQTYCMELAVESEMAGNSDVVADFKRLLHAKPPIKLIIFDRGPKYGPMVVVDIEEELRRYRGHVKGEQYFVFDCHGDRDDRKFHCYSWTVPHNESIDVVRLETVEGTPIAYKIGDSGRNEVTQP